MKINLVKCIYFYFIYIFFVSTFCINAEEIEELYDLARNGDKNAQILLALKFSNGEGLKKDLFELFLLYKHAAKQDNCEATFLLGIFYENGYWVNIDYNEALYWYDKTNEISTHAHLNAYFGSERIWKNYNRFIKSSNELPILFKTYRDDALEYYLKKDYYKAIDLSIKAIEHGYIGCNLILAECFYYIKYYNEALYQVKICFDLQKEFDTPIEDKAFLYYLLGLIYKRSGNDSEANENFKHANELDPSKSYIFHFQLQ